MRYANAHYPLFVLASCRNAVGLPQGGGSSTDKEITRNLSVGQIVP
jgi:hypothetical protein